MIKTIGRFRLVLWMAALAALMGSASFFAAAQADGTSPQQMPISLKKPTPPPQNGIELPYGDGNTWVFQIAPGGKPFRWVDGPHWHHSTGGGGVAPDWGTFNPLKPFLSLTWISGASSGTFSVSVSGQIVPIGDGGGGGDGTLKPIDIKADWSGNIAAKDWKPKPAIGIIVDETGDKIGENGRMTAPQDQTKDPAEPKNVVVPIGGALTCTVEDATDTDYWQKTDGNENILDSGYEADGAVSYKWSATEGKGTFTDSDQASTTWTAPAEPGTYTLSCKIDDPHADDADPEVTGVGEDEEGTRNDAAITRSVTVTVVKVEMANPTGDPTKSAEAVKNQNEFTFNTASPGVLTIQCRATLTPDNAITQAWAEENVSWEVSDIAGSTKSWTDTAGAAADNKGKKVNCRFTTLPSSNAAFGLKTVTMTVGDEDTGRNIEVFFDRDATNHPPLTSHPMYRTSNGKANLLEKFHIKWKNWAYYWMQSVSPLGAFPRFTYFNVNARAVYRPVTGIIELDDSITAGTYDAPYGIYNPLKGIDTFSWAVIHESQHYKDWVDFWNNDAATWVNHRGLTGPKDDMDSDRIPNDIEDKDLSNTYNAGDLYDWQNYNTPTTGRPEDIENDFEDWDCQRHTTQKGDHSKDWGSPGMQHKTNDTWNN